MNPHANETSQSFVIQTDEEKIEAVFKASLDDTARRLKLKFSETQKSGASECAEVGCVPWYHFQQAGK